jgi:hypothetical protein
VRLKLRSLVGRVEGCQVGDGTVRLKLRSLVGRQRPAVPGKLRNLLGTSAATFMTSVTL